MIREEEEEVNALEARRTAAQEQEKKKKINNKVFPRFPLKQNQSFSFPPFFFFRYLTLLSHPFSLSGIRNLQWVLLRQLKISQALQSRRSFWLTPKIYEDASPRPHHPYPLKPRVLRK